MEIAHFRKILPTILNEKKIVLIHFFIFKPNKNNKKANCIDTIF